MYIQIQRASRYICDRIIISPEESIKHAQSFPGPQVVVGIGGKRTDLFRCILNRLLQRD